MAKAHHIGGAKFPAGIGHEATRPCTPSARILPSVIAGPGGCFIFAADN